MGVFFRFTESGEILAARIPFASTVDDETFQKRAKKISLEIFLEKFSSEERETLLKELMVIKKMNFRNVTVVGPVIQFLDGEGYYESGCIIDGKYFPGFHQDSSVRKEAIAYGYDRYGKAFMDMIISNKHLEMISRTQIEKLEMSRRGIFYPDDALVYLNNDLCISKQEYDKLMQMKENLLAVRNVNNPLQKNIKSKKV